MASGLSWTIGRPPRLTDGPLTLDYRVGSDFIVGMRAHVSRKTLAHHMLSILDDSMTYQRAFTITQ